MEDLYRHLRTVIGNTADLLALDRELKLRQGQILLDSPTSAISQGVIDIGNASDRNQFRLTKEELTNHLLIAGRTGAGKTNTSLQVISSLIKEKVPFIIFDWKKTHRNLVTMYPSVKVYTVGRDASPFYFNPLIPPPGVTPKNWALILSQIWEASSLLGPGASHLLLRAFDYLYKSFGIYDNPESENYPTMHDLLSYLETMDIKKFREAQWLSSAKRAVQGICFGDAGKALRAQKHASDSTINNLLTQNTVLELETLTHSSKIFFIYSLLLWLHHHDLNTQDRGQLKRVLILEECHHLLSKQFRRTTSTEDVLENMLREAREFGTGFIMLFQTVSSIPSTALSNIHTIVCHNLVHDLDLTAMSNILLLDQREKKYISQLQVGQATVKLQTRYTKPFLITVPYFDITRDRILSDPEIREQRATYSPITVREPTPTSQSKTDSPSSPGAINDDELAFLLSTLQRPFIGTTTRYRELGLYNKKGNAIKTRLLGLEFIKDIPVQLSRQRTMKLAELTERGKAHLRILGHTAKYDLDSKGGLEHAFWVHLIRKSLVSKGYRVNLEERGVDIVARNNNQETAIEVETGNSYPARNILKCIQLGFPRIVSVATNPEAHAIIKRFITHFKLQDRVTLVLARDLLYDSLVFPQAT